MTRRYNEKLSILTIVCLLLATFAFHLPYSCGTIDVIEICPKDTSTTAAVEWSDDFEDLDISDWTIEQGDFSVDDGTLRPNGTGWNRISYPSTVAFGTWSFDLLYVDVPPLYFTIYFIDNSGTYDLLFNDENAIWLNARYGYGPLENQGWHNYTITRAENGYIVIYMDNDPTLEAFAGSTINSSTLFRFESYAGPAIDNIMVDDTITLDAIGPVLTDPPVSQMIHFGDDYRFDINATDTSGVETWTVNNTDYFEIDSNGVLTNSVELPLGNHALRIIVTDMLGNARIKDIVLTVYTETTTPTTTPISPHPPAWRSMLTYSIVIGFVILSIIIIIVIAGILKKPSP